MGALPPRYHRDFLLSAGWHVATVLRVDWTVSGLLRFNPVSSEFLVVLCPTY